MQVTDLIEKCQESLAHPEYSCGRCLVRLTVPLPKRGFRYQRYLLPFGRKGPRAQMMAPLDDTHAIVLVSAQEILDWIAKVEGEDLRMEVER